LINDGSETRMSEASIAQWRAIPVAVISDELNRGGTMAAAIKPVGEGMGFAGQALTARTMVGDNATLHYAVASAWPGCVIVVDARGHVDTAVWGGILNHAAQVKGVAALVVDGVVTGVCLAAGEPAIERRIGLVEHRVSQRLYQ
jgi:4-hydroxy-4-methyl-2-oxoglutarate aldolase